MWARRLRYRIHSLFLFGAGATGKAMRLRDGNIDVLPAEEFFAGLYGDLLPER